MSCPGSLPSGKTECAILGAATFVADPGNHRVVGTGDRTDFVRQIAPAGTDTWNYGNTKGVSLVPWYNLEFDTMARPTSSTIRRPKMAPVIFPCC